MGTQQYHVERAERLVEDANTRRVELKELVHAARAEDTFDEHERFFWLIQDDINATLAAAQIQATLSISAPMDKAAPEPKPEGATVTPDTPKPSTPDIGALMDGIFKLASAFPPRG